MNPVQRVAKNISVMFVSQIITYVLAFIFVMYSARYLGVDNFGILSFALAFSGIMIIFADLGLSSLMVREASRNKKLMESYLKNILSLKLILGISTFIISILIVLALGYNLSDIQVIAIITAYTLLTSLSSMFYALFQTFEKLEYQSIGQIITSILLISGALYLIYNKSDLLGFALLYLFVGVIMVLYAFTICKCNYVSPKLEIDFGFWKTLLKMAIPLSVVLIFSTIAFRIDIVILSMLDTNTAVGIYSAAYKLIEVLTFIPAVFTASIYPVFSRFHIYSKNSLKTGYKRSFKYLFLIGLPIATTVSLLADEIILLVYGTQFTGSIIALKILIWAIPFTFLTFFSGTVMISINKQNLLAKIFILAIIMNVVLNVTFIPSYGYVASAVITIITELTEMLLISYFLFKFICKVEIKDTLVKPLIACLVMGLFIFYVHINLLLQIVLAFGVYLVALYLLETFSDDDINLIKQLIPNKKK